MRAIYESIIMTKATMFCGLALLTVTCAIQATAADPRGPIEYPRMKAAADEQGPQAPG